MTKLVQDCDSTVSGAINKGTCADAAPADSRVDLRVRHPKYSSKSEEVDRRVR